VRLGQGVALEVGRGLGGLVVRLDLVQAQQLHPDDARGVQDALQLAQLLGVAAGHEQAHQRFLPVGVGVGSVPG
jgi:hypothetical protein